nr:hypothetical protein [uncultured Methanospirillum sp.]
MGTTQADNISGTQQQTAQIAQAVNTFINPDNPNVKLQTLNDVMDCCFIMRSTLAGLFNSELEKIREVIQEGERKKAIKDLNERLETKHSFEKRVIVGNADDLKQIIKQVKAYDHLKENFMSRAGFISSCKQQGIDEEQADLIYISQTFDIEKRRRLINDNLMMLAD